MVLTAGLALLTLALSLWLIDVKGWRRATRPAVVFGSNPLVVFVGSGLLARTLSLLRVGDGLSVHRWLFLHIFQPVGGDVNGSLLQALAHLGLWLAVLWWLYRRRLFVRL